MFERFHQDARQAVVLARENSQRLRHPFIGTEHLLLGLLDQRATLSARVLGRRGLDYEQAYQAVARMTPRRPSDTLDADALESIGIDLSAVRERVEAAFGPGALDRAPVTTRRGQRVSGRHTPLTGRAKKVLELSLREALALRQKTICDGHLLLGILREGGGLASRVIADAGIDAGPLRQEIVLELR
ncbi:Clp protease N-terminal domain-containing protein [Streptosporangium sp. NPDC051022]|uniref:Clp protease N-terminal domain-containing protein n=1 Tax=Streptosporangium sp. NPDC051022 TaxID=3155752 RepID=UPI00341FA833